MTSQMNTITIDLPMKVDVEEAKFMIFLSLFGKGSISSGKASSYLNMDRLTFLNRASSYGMILYSEDENNLEDALSIDL